MNTKKENDILEIALSIAESGYAEAYRFLAEAYENDTGNFGPQTLYFLACWAGGAGMSQKALAWIRRRVLSLGFLQNNKLKGTLNGKRKFYRGKQNQLQLSEL